jgi:hypothetical protein
MRIRTVVGLAIATAATAGGVALGTAAFASDPGTEPVYRINETSSSEYAPAAGREDCPEKNGGGQGEAPGQGETPGQSETAPAETL